MLLSNMIVITMEENPKTKLFLKHSIRYMQTSGFLFVFDSISYNTIVERIGK